MPPSTILKLEFPTRRSISLPGEIIEKIDAIASIWRVSSNRAIVDLLPDAIQACENRRAALLELADQFQKSSIQLRRNVSAMIWLDSLLAPDADKFSGLALVQGLRLIQTLRRRTVPEDVSSKGQSVNGAPYFSLKSTIARAHHP